MQVWYLENIVYAAHPENETAEVGKPMVEQVDRYTSELLKRYPKVAVYHDVSHTKTVANEVLQAWAAIGSKYKDRGTYVCLVPGAWLRTMVKTVAFLGRIDIKIVKDETEAAAYLAANGFTLRTGVKPAA